MLFERVATPLVTRVMLLALGIVVVSKAMQMGGSFPTASARELIDFDAFRIAGQMAWRGDIADAYRFSTMMQAQLELGGSRAFMPWTYPPPFNLIAAGLAVLPPGLSYFVFVGLTLAGFLAVLRRLSGPHFAAIVFMVFPALATTVSCGQNGFLTGTLIGLACLGLMRDRTIAGVPLGLMVIKPHLAITLAFYVAVTRRWTCMMVAASVTMASAGVATLVFGSRIWPAFLQGVEEAGGFLVAGHYPLFRMVSIYATLRSVDLPPSFAMLIQAASAGAAFYLVAVSIRRRKPTSQILGLTVLCSLTVSPYMYDYDLTLYAVALALLMGDLLCRTTIGEQCALAVLSWITCGYGLLTNMVFRLPSLAGTSAASAEIAPLLPPAITGPLLLLLVVFVWRVLQRGDVGIPVGSARMSALA